MSCVQRNELFWPFRLTVIFENRWLCKYFNSLSQLSELLLCKFKISFLFIMFSAVYISLNASMWQLIGIDCIVLLYNDYKVSIWMKKKEEAWHCLKMLKLSLNLPCFDFIKILQLFWKNTKKRRKIFLHLRILSWSLLTCLVYFRRTPKNCYDHRLSVKHPSNSIVVHSISIQNNRRNNQKVRCWQTFNDLFTGIIHYEKCYCMCVWQSR